MSFVLTPSALALATAIMLGGVSASDSSHCSQQCDQLSYCDDFENKCKPCSGICDDGSDLMDCRNSCAQYHYMHNIVDLYSAQRLQPSQLHVLTIMVTLTAIMTSVIMMLLLVLMRMKMKKKRVIKKVTPSVLFTVDSQMDAKDTKMESLGIKELEKPGQQNQDFNRSMSTVITQLSNDSSNHTENFTSGVMRQSRNSFNSRTKRLPSEDCVPNFEKYKPSLDPTKEMSPRERQFCEVV